MSSKVTLVRVPKLTSADFNPPIKVIAAALARQKRAEEAERAIFGKLDAALRAAAAARMASVAALRAEKVARKSRLLASRAEGERNRRQFTGGYYFCYGPVPGVTCKNKYGPRHFSPSYRGSDMKCPHCRKRQYKFSAIIERKDGLPKSLNVNSAPWYPAAK